MKTCVWSVVPWCPVAVCFCLAGHPVLMWRSRFPGLLSPICSTRMCTHPTLLGKRLWRERHRPLQTQPCPHGGPPPRPARGPSLLLWG